MHRSVLPRTQRSSYLVWEARQLSATGHQQTSTRKSAISNRHWPLKKRETVDAQEWIKKTNPFIFTDEKAGTKTYSGTLREAFLTSTHHWQVTLTLPQEQACPGNFNTDLVHKSSAQASAMYSGEKAPGG